MAGKLLTVWALDVRYTLSSLLRNYAVPLTAASILISSVTPEPTLTTGVLLAGLVVVNIAVERLTVESR